MVPLDKSPEVLRDRRGRTRQEARLHAPPADSGLAWAATDEYLSLSARRTSSPDRWERLKTAQPRRSISGTGRARARSSRERTAARSARTRPAARRSPGWSTVTLDTPGRLRASAPRRRRWTTAPTGAPAALDWNAALRRGRARPGAVQPVGAAAGFRASPSTRARRGRGLTRRSPEMPIHVEAAAYARQARLLRNHRPLGPPARRHPNASAARGERALGVLRSLGLLRRVRRPACCWRAGTCGSGAATGGRVPPGRVRLRCRSCWWLFAAHHVADARRSSGFMRSCAGRLRRASSGWSTSRSSRSSGGAGRRIVSWSRLLAGGFRDPLVGRDALAGISSARHHADVLVSKPLPSWLDLRGMTPCRPRPSSSSGFPSFWASSCSSFRMPWGWASR